MQKMYNSYFCSKKLCILKEKTMWLFGTYTTRKKWKMKHNNNNKKDILDHDS